jgi:tripartite ATP-independent transporter DctM subunit
MLALFGSFFGLLFLGVPVFYALAGSSMLFFWLEGIPVWTIIQRQFVGLNSFIQVAIPLFVLAGNLMDAGGGLKRIVRFAEVTVGRFKGGMAHVNVLASLMFSGATGSAVAQVAALGPLSIKMMDEQGYDKKYATALICASASVGPITPPSIPLVMYGVVSGASVGALLMAGIIPGILMSIALMIQVVYYARKYNFPTSKAFPLKVMLKEALPALGTLSVVVVVIGGIYTGLCTPTEAAGLACLAAFILGKFVYKELKWKDLPGIFVKTARVLGSVSAIFAVAACFSYAVVFENMPKVVGAFLLNITTDKFVMLLLVNLLFLIVGCFMEGLSTMLIVTPMILPILTGMGVDPVHLGVILAINLTLGLLTPPLGLSIFMASSIANVPAVDIMKKVIPMFLILVAVMLLVTYIPEISLFLPNAMLR